MRMIAPLHTPIGHHHPSPPHWLPLGSALQFQGWARYASPHSPPVEPPVLAALEQLQPMPLPAAVQQLAMHLVTHPSQHSPRQAADWPGMATKQIQIQMRMIAPLHTPIGHHHPSPPHWLPLGSALRFQGWARYASPHSPPVEPSVLAALEQLQPMLPPAAVQQLAMHLVTHPSQHCPRQAAFPLNPDWPGMATKKV
ncbi:hypothetical protein AALO_G00226680 [Alosa alosa]|uniref:Uncharacterized protein n=1 Tax=Alosa alosa TaxID=278164 RepID=A0AAV6FYC1_9TELE|nr:hypothetical protein AALO_G00226680 [Alosa alosa]